jgi:hypothetical protein
MGGRDVDLNAVSIRADGGDEGLEDYSVASSDGSVEVVFRGIRDRLIKEISGARYVVGCVAWLTCPDILKALGRCNGVLITVQKEDFLRPDTESPTAGYWRGIRKQMDTLPVIDRARFHPGLIGNLNVCCGNQGDAIRCVGNHNSERSHTHPKAHHKFVVFCDADEHRTLVPRAVWTGSFNFTRTATRSLENAVILKDPAIVGAFFNEFQQVYALSEPLDWETPYSDPEYRIGT